MFIIRSYNDQNLRENSSIELVAVSLAASLFSISNKFTWTDKEAVVDKAKEPKFKAHCPCVNGWYVLRIVWRFSFVATRFCILSLVWSVLGGAFLGIFLAVSFLVWGCRMTFANNDGVPEMGDLSEISVSIASCCLFGCVSLISSPVSEKWSELCIHGFEMTLSLSLITIFAYTQFDCGICADSYSRQAGNNPYIFMFIIAGWTTLGIDFITYGVLLYSSIFDDEDLNSLGGILRFADEIEMA